MLLCQSQKFCRKHVCLHEALIREVFKIQGYWSFLKAKTEKACSLFENPRFFISNQLFLKNIQEILVVFPCQLKTMLTPQKLPCSNYHPLKGMLTKAVPASSLQLHRAPRLGYAAFRSWRNGVAWGSLMAIGNSQLVFHWLGGCNQQKQLLCDKRFQEKTLSTPEKKKIPSQRKEKFQTLIFSRN